MSRWVRVPLPPKRSSDECLICWETRFQPGLLLDTGDYICHFCWGMIKRRAEKEPDLGMPWALCEVMIFHLQLIAKKVQKEGYVYRSELVDAEPPEMTPEIEIQLVRRNRPQLPRSPEGQKPKLKRKDAPCLSRAGVRGNGPERSGDDMARKSVFTCDACGSEDVKVRDIFLTIYEDEVHLLKEHRVHVCYRCWSPDINDEKTRQRAMSFKKFFKAMLPAIGGKSEL